MFIRRHAKIAEGPLNQMNIKLVAIALLVLLAFFALIQIESIASLNPILYSMATSVRYIVTWVFQLQTESEKQVVFKSKHQLLNPSDEIKVVPSTISTPKPMQQPDHTSQPRPSNEDVNFDFLLSAIEPEPTYPTISNEDEEIAKILSSIVGSEDPVTNLFPDTECQDTGLNLDDFYYDEFWKAALETKNVPANDDIGLTQVEQLLEGFRPDASNHSDVDQLDAFGQN